MTRLLVGGRLYWLSPRFVLMAVPIIIYALIESTSWDVFWVGEQLLATVEFTRLMKAKGGGSEYWWGVLTLFAAINWPLVALTIQQFSGPPLNIFPCIMFDAVWKEFFRLSLSLSLLCCDYWGEKGVHRVACPVGRPGIQTTDQGNKVLYPG
jgi:hypothetical protein